MPRARIGEGEYYHIFNRGVDKCITFRDDTDRWRFLTLLILLQGEVYFPQVGRLVSVVKSWSFDKNEDFEEVLMTKSIDLVGFCLMPNHFHLLLRELKEGGISKFMQRLLGAYTKYFNTRYHRSGHLFGGKFQSAHVDEDRYLNYLSAYIHMNPRDIKEWRHREEKYPWSSFQDYVKQNRFGAFLNNTVILDQFNNGMEYQKFVEKSPAKKLKDELGGSCLLD